MNKLSLPLLFISSLLMSGCGGGGGSSSAGTDSGTDSGTGSGSGTNSGDVINRYGIKYRFYQTGRVIYDDQLHVDSAVQFLEGEGTQRLVFKDWGNIEIKESELVKTGYLKAPLSGSLDGTIHELKKSIIPKYYRVDFEKEKIFVSDDTEMFETNVELGLIKKDPLMPSSLIGGKIGDTITYPFGYTDTLIAKKVILGVPCDEIESKNDEGVHVDTSCFHGNIMLSSVSGDGTSSVIATKIDFDIDINDSEFAIPNYPQTTRINE